MSYECNLANGDETINDNRTDEEFITNDDNCEEINNDDMIDDDSDDEKCHSDYTNKYFNDIKQESPIVPR